MLMLQAQPAGVSTGSVRLGRPPFAFEGGDPDQFHPTDMRCWLSRGRSDEQATDLARI